MKIVKCFDKIEKVSQFNEIRHENCEKTFKGAISYIEDCDFFHPVRETEKAFCFDMGEDHTTLKRFVYAPKSKCKEIEDDFYIEKEKLVLVPRWIIRNW